MKSLFGCLLACVLVLCCSVWSLHAAQYDVNWDGTGDFTSIQDAIDATVDGDVIVVHPGTYCENIHFGGKNITLRSVDPEDEEIVASTVIDGSQKASVVTFAGTEDETCLLSGFTIANGKSDYGAGILGADPWADPLVYTLAAISNCTVRASSARWDGGGFYGSDGSISNCAVTGNSAEQGGGLASCGGTISNCTIAGNSAFAAYSGTGRGGGLVSCGGTIKNCTISGNSAEWGNGGVANCDGTIENCIVWGNQVAGQPDEIRGCEGASITFSCIRGWTGGGEGNISDDPLFVTGPLGDHYLSSQAAGQGENSPCIDAGSGVAESLGLDQLTTRTDGMPDIGSADMVYHYPIITGLAPMISCFLNNELFFTGDELVGSVGIENHGPDTTVDVYVAFVMPDGAILCVSPTRIDFGIFPYQTDLFLPQGLSLEPAPFVNMIVPGGLSGDFLFAAALSTPGEFEIIGEPSLFQFTLRADAAAAPR